MGLLSMETRGSWEQAAAAKRVLACTTLQRSAFATLQKAFEASTLGSNH